jgi:hypothetical protein
MNVLSGCCSTRSSRSVSEPDHCLQGELKGGPARNHLTAQNADEFTTTSEVARRAVDALKRYNFGTVGEAAAEVGVRLMRPAGYGIPLPSALSTRQLWPYGRWKLHLEVWAAELLN